MKKTIAVLTALIMITGTAAATFVPVASSPSDPLFSSPALTARTEKDIGIGTMNRMGSDISALSFLSDPVKGLDRTARWLSEEMAAKDISFWKENPSVTQVFRNMDPENFPSDLTDEEHAMFQIREYFGRNFLSEGYGAVNRAHVIRELSMDHPELFPVDSSAILGGDLRLGTELYGLHAHDGFAWRWDVALGYATAESLLRGNGSLSLEASVNASYAFSLFSPAFTVGINAEPSIVIDNIQSGPSFLGARMADDIISLFTEPLRFGTGIKLDLGLMWEPSTDLTFTLDFRNAPSFRSYFEWELPALADGDLMPSRDRNIYYEAPDIALSAIWESGDMHFKAEIAHIMDQLLWMNEISEYEFNYYQVADLTFAYDIDEELTLRTRLGKERLMLGVEWNGFSAELTTKLDRGYLGITVGYEW